MLFFYHIMSRLIDVLHGTVICCVVKVDVVVIVYSTVDSDKLDLSRSTITVQPFLASLMIRPFVNSESSSPAFDEFRLFDSGRVRSCDSSR